MKYNPKKHHRRSTRLKNYDYSQEGLYFITLNCQNRHHLFGKIQNSVMCLNEFGTIIHQNWLETPIIRPNVTLGAFVVMPDHMHAIICIKQTKGSKEAIGKFQSPSQTIGAIVRGFKGTVTTKIKTATRTWITSKGEFAQVPTVAPIPPGPINLIHLEPKKSIWQRGYDDRIIWNQKSLKNITKYIQNNPANWKGKSVVRAESE